MPNPTDTARALVEKLEQAAHTNGWNDGTDKSAIKTLDDARAALLAHVDTLRIERDGFKELYEEWLTWAKGAVEKCKPEIPPSDSPQAQGIIDERLAYVAGVEQQLARYKEIYESNSAAFIAIRKAFGIEADETVVPYILKYAPPLATRPTEARDDG